MTSTKTNAGVMPSVAARLAAIVLAAVALLAAVPATARADAAQAVAGKKYVIATDTTFAPFEWQEGGKLVGIDMDLIRAIADVEGFTVDIRSLGFNAALQAVTSGTADGAIAGASITDERKLSYDFSEPYFESGIQMAVRSTDDEIHGYEDLAGKVVTAKVGSEGERYANELAEQYGFTVKAVDQASTMYEVIRSGNAVAVFDDYPVIAYGIKQGNGLKTVTQKVPGASYGFLVAKGANHELMAAFNEGLAKLQNDGTYDKILDKYLGSSSDEASTAPVRPDFLELCAQSFPALMEGLKNTVIITLVSFVVALVIGILMGLARVSGITALVLVSRFYVWLFRGTPVLVWAFFFYFGIPQIIGTPVNVWIAGGLTLALNSGAYLAEVVRGAINSVDAGQMEAGRSLGASYGLTMRRVVLPQAFVIALPSVVNQLIIMVKDSSLLLAIGFGELLYQAQQIYAANFRVTETLIMVAVIYLVTITILTRLARLATRRLS